MIVMEWRASGIFAAALNPRLRRLLRERVREAHYETWSWWCRLPASQGIGLRMRFTRDAFSRLRLTARAGHYARRQQWRYGKALPYRSLEKQPEAMHMAGRMKAEGPGWRAVLKGRGLLVESRLTLPGARVLNRLSGKGYPEYAREFLAFDGAGSSDADAIQDHLEERLSAVFEDIIAEQPETEVTAREQ